MDGNGWFFGLQNSTMKDECLVYMCFIKQEPIQKSFQGTYGIQLHLIDLHSHHSHHTSNDLVYTSDYHRQICHLRNGKVLKLSI